MWGLRCAYETEYRKSTNSVIFKCDRENEELKVYVEKSSLTLLSTETEIIDQQPMFYKTIQLQKLLTNMKEYYLRNKSL